MTTLYSFGAELRLRCAADYKGVFNGALLKCINPISFSCKTFRTAKQPFGFSCCQEKVRRAHERNRVKRLARESFRLHQQQLDDLDIVVMPKVGIEAVPNAELHQQLQFAWQKLNRLAKSIPK